MRLSRLAGFTASGVAALLAMNACGRVEYSGFDRVTAGNSGQAEQPAGGSAEQAAAGRPSTVLAGAAGSAPASDGGAEQTSGGGASAGIAGDGGAMDIAGDGGAMGIAGSAATGTPHVADGFHCGGSLECPIGALCMFCGSDYFCAPDPQLDHAGHAAAVAHCPNADTLPEGSFLVGQCDGPEDCANGEYCVAKRDIAHYPLLLLCSPAPGLSPIDCSCLGCWYEKQGLHSCTLCRQDADCQPGDVCDPGSVGLWNNDVRGCHAPR
ncbi:MAG TPA: hypothetical protein VFK05_07120 [Polyangiaceae bacterium]|nr:hypothetical protein [Polyangiaceae bacterium]